MADNLNVIRDVPHSGHEAGDAAAENPFTRSVEDERREGRSALPSGRFALFGYDRVQGMANSSGRYGADLTDRMSWTQGKMMLERLHNAHGVARSMEGFLFTYDQALFVCHALNGASQIAPLERVSFHVVSKDGRRQSFDFRTIATVLGVDMRRFFRTFANETVAACRELYQMFDLEDPEMIELRAQLVALADKRGVSRYPWLVADSADAATDLTPGESAAVHASKSLVIASSTNAVDKRNLATPIRSLDNYDSSTGQSVSRNVDIHAGTGGSMYYN